MGLCQRKVPLKKRVKVFNFSFFYATISSKVVLFFTLYLVCKLGSPLTLAFNATPTSAATSWQMMCV